MMMRPDFYFNYYIIQYHSEGDAIITRACYIRY